MDEADVSQAHFREAFMVEITPYNGEKAELNVALASALAPHETLGALNLITTSVGGGSDLPC